MDKENKSSWMNYSLIFPGCMFVGMGIGFLFDALQVGLFIGMGVGFISIGLIKLFRSSDSN